jgi:universal stress protein E
MEKLTSILVVANRSTADRVLLGKAVALARCIGAQIYLFSCDAALARRLRHSYPTAEAEKAWNICLAEHLTYLRRLQAEVCAPDVQMSVDAACHSPIHEEILRKVREIRADLVMKSPAGAHPLRRVTLESSDRRLAAVCPTTLMLVRGRPWRAVPRFGAFVDVSEDGTAQFAQTIVHSSLYFVLGCQGELQIIYSEASDDRREIQERSESLDRLVREYHIDASHVHRLSGIPQDVLPEFAASQGYDAIVLGANSHRKSLVAVHGTLTSRIADAVQCDTILIERNDRPLPHDPMRDPDLESFVIEDVVHQ